MMTYDFAPLFRTAVGFDRLARLADTLPQDVTSYPPLPWQGLVLNILR